ncbi:Proteasome subunit beta type-7 [Portunus trituberculatus]|uniref:Proteasome subunit beta n=1 Tax=Portunus trituberculatus TaxID=210409 RepID=A0A5B7JQ32_PORTR|nr:Proteasome subunit beta type-7 [Portunus trituberculatus]
MPKSRKTGTTIAGIVFKDGVVLGADTRATEGDIVADKNCCKIHYLQPNMYCCGAGTAADLEMTTQMMASQLELHRLNTGRQVPVIAANTMLKQMLFRYQVRRTHTHTHTHILLSVVVSTFSFVTTKGPIALAYDTQNQEHPLQIAGTCPGLAEPSWDGFISIPVLRMLSQWKSKPYIYIIKTFYLN